MAYTSNNKSTGLDTLSTLDSGDLIIFGDISDSGRAKAITKTNLLTDVFASPTLTGSITLSGFTAGSVLFAGASGVITQDNASLFFDNANNRLGIGTATPEVALQMNYSDTTAYASDLTPGAFSASIYCVNTGAAGFAMLELQSTASSGGAVGQGAVVVSNESATGVAASLIFTTRQVSDSHTIERMRITSAGNVKIANTTAAPIVRATTEGTNHLDIFNGTAPVGTLANGVSFYSESGLPKVMTAAGNTGEIITASAVNTVSATSPNRTLTITVGGTTYYIHAKTTND